MPKSSRKSRPSKPSKDFPLVPHASGRWAKKVRGKFAYFGKVADDPKGEAALAKWLNEKDDLLAGRTPRVAGDGLAVADLCSKLRSIPSWGIVTKACRHNTAKRLTMIVCGQRWTRFTRGCSPRPPLATSSRTSTVS